MDFETKMLYKNKELQNDLEFMKGETHGLMRMEIKFRQMGYLD